MNTMAVSLPRRVIQVGSRAVRHLLPPTLYFFVAFNLISFTTHLDGEQTIFRSHHRAKYFPIACIQLLITIHVERLESIAQHPIYLLGS